MTTKNKIWLSITGIVVVLLITIGFSYAYFSANLTGGEESTTITVTGGTINIVYSGGPNINVANIIPSDNPVATKTFTVTGNNTIDIEMQYKLILVIETNTFSEEALKYKLISTNTNNNGTAVPSIISLINIGTGSKTLELGIGEFASPTGGNKVHTYSLEIYFPNANYNQNEDQGKELKSHINIEHVSYLEYDAEKGVNKPALAEGLVPIKWDGNSWLSTTPEDSEWYDYNNKKWANVATIDNSKLFEHSNNKYNGIINGAVQQEDGMYFDGIDDYIQTDSVLKNYDFGSSITMIARFKIHSLNLYQSLLGNWEDAGGGIQITTDNKIRFLLNINDVYKAVDSTISINNNDYYTVVGTYDGNNIKLYINGELARTNNVIGSIKPSPVNIAIGYNENQSIASFEYANATISHAAIYKTTLNESQISTDFSDIPKFNKNNLLFAYDLRKTKDIEPETIMNIEDLSTMWVWIPRYAYKILNGYHSNETGEIDVLFLKDKTINNKEKITIETSGYDADTKNTSQHYFLHPAFNQGGEEITGYWVAKYEASNTADNLKFIPNVSSLRNMTIGEQFDSAYNIKNNSTYGWNSNQIDSHMITNIEWGAATYLAHSKYGANNEIWINNSNTYTTGCAGNSVSASSYNGCQNAYNTENGQKASTTHNIYGVYDMSGGAWEYVSAYIENGNNNLTTYGQNIANAANKYKNVYAKAPNDNRQANYIYNKNIYGEAIYETSNNEYCSSCSWNGDYAYMPYLNSPWFIRGGGYVNTSTAGIFHFADYSGIAHQAYSFRATIFINS